MKALKPVLDIAGEFIRAPTALELRRAPIALASVGGCPPAERSRGSAKPRDYAYSCAAAIFRRAVSMIFFCFETYSRQYPFSNVSPSAAEWRYFQLNGDLEALTAVGEFRSRPASFAPSRMIGRSVRSPGSALSDLSRRRQAELNSAPRAGTLSIAGGRIAKQTLAPIETTMSLSDNGLRFLQPVPVSIFGGEITVADLAWPDLLNDPKRVSFSAELKHVGLEP